MPSQSTGLKPLPQTAPASSATVAGSASAAFAGVNGVMTTAQAPATSAATKKVSTAAASRSMAAVKNYFYQSLFFPASPTSTNKKASTVAISLADVRSQQNAPSASSFADAWMYASQPLFVTPSPPATVPAATKKKASTAEALMSRAAAKYPSQPTAPDNLNTTGWYQVPQQITAPPATALATTKKKALTGETSSAAVKQRKIFTTNLPAPIVVTSKAAVKQRKNLTTNLPAPTTFTPAYAQGIVD